MKLEPSLRRSVASPARGLRPLQAALAAAAALLAPASQAVDFGPFSLNGFAKAEFTHNSNNCPDCQKFPQENKQRYWADELVPGAEFKDHGLHTTLFQPYLGVKFDLGGGYKLQGLLSQRWRDGKEDIPGFLYEKNIALSHEDYGSVRIGTMTTRTWSVADYPYGSNVGLSDVWGSAGAGYGLLTKAIRVTTRPLDVLDGDLVLEATYDMGNTDFKKNKPQFWEFYAQYYRGDLVIDASYQDARNGTPSAWSHGPFTGLTPFSEDDAKLGSSGQSVALLMGRYQLTPQWEVSGGLKHNRWSGAYATITKIDSSGVAQWNSMFNVDWTQDLGGGIYRGYAANSTDWLLGLRYRMGQWIAATGMTRLGKASTDNPTEDGQSNSVTWNTVQLTYEFAGELRGLQVYGMGGYIRYGLDAVSKGCNGQPNRVPGTCSLSPMSMPGNAAFTNVDSRVARSGNYVGIGVVYAF
ncbi:MAG: hypothetical protein JNL87_21960 [Burkholderiaceae bacterium]|nr:hypothetical protein [Burkholderiaceae bacterium]